MKKTSYMILAIIALTIVAAAAAPAFLFKKGSLNITMVRLSGNKVRLETDIKMSIDIVQDYYGITADEEEGYDPDTQFPLQVVIRECDSVSTAVVVMDKTWADNVTLNQTAEKALTMYIDMHTLAADNQKPDRITYKPSERTIAEILVPRNTLKEVKSFPVNVILSFPVNVILEDFKDASMHLSGNIDVKNSSFASLSF